MILEKPLLNGKSNQKNLFDNLTGINLRASF